MVRTIYSNLLPILQSFCLHISVPLSVAQVAERQHLHSASHHLLVMQRFQMHTYAVRLPCRHCGCADDMELILRWSLRSWSEHWQLLTHSQHVSVRTIFRAFSALEALCDYALYKSTFTLHLHYILVGGGIMSSTCPCILHPFVCLTPN